MFGMANELSEQPLSAKVANEPLKAAGISQLSAWMDRSAVAISAQALPSLSRHLGGTPSSMTYGTIKWWDGYLGSGVVVSDSDGMEFPIILPMLFGVENFIQGQNVEFELMETQTGKVVVSYVTCEEEILAHRERPRPRPPKRSD
jgi:cold shock CspA family protein